MSSLNITSARFACGVRMGAGLPGLQARGCRTSHPLPYPFTPLAIRKKFRLNKIIFYTCPCKISLITRCFCFVKLFLFKKDVYSCYTFKKYLLLTLCSIASPIITAPKPSCQSFRWPPNYEFVRFLFQLIFLSSSFLDFTLLTLSHF